MKSWYKWSAILFILVWIAWLVFFVVLGGFVVRDTALIFFDTSLLSWSEFFRLLLGYVAVLAMVRVLLVFIRQGIIASQLKKYSVYLEITPRYIKYKALNGYVTIDKDSLMRISYFDWGRGGVRSTTRSINLEYTENGNKRKRFVFIDGLSEDKLTITDYFRKMYPEQFN